MPQSSTAQILQQLPISNDLTIQLIMAAAGIVLWVLGARLARPICSLAGAVVGGLTAHVLAGPYTNASMTLAWSIIGGLVGCIMAWLMFRICMSLVATLFFAFIFAAAIACWTGSIPSINQQNSNWPWQPLTSTTDRSDASSQSSSPLNRLHHIYQNMVQSLSDWTANAQQQLQTSDKLKLVGVALLGGAVGLVMGLAWPTTCAAVASSLAGTILMLLPAAKITQRWTTDQQSWLPGSFNHLLLLAGLITLLGCVIQWTILRRKTDK